MEVSLSARRASSLAGRGAWTSAARESKVGKAVTFVSVSWLVDASTASTAPVSIGSRGGDGIFDAHCPKDEPTGKAPRW